MQQCPTQAHSMWRAVGRAGPLLTGRPSRRLRLALQLPSQVLHQLQVPAAAAYQAPFPAASPGPMQQHRSLASRWLAGYLGPMHHSPAAALRPAWLTGSHDQMPQPQLLHQVPCSLMQAAMVQQSRSPGQQSSQRLEAGRMGAHKFHQPCLMSADLMQARLSPLALPCTRLPVPPEPTTRGQACPGAVAAPRACSEKSAGLFNGLVQVGGT